jgi:hypothetical protein
MQIDPEYRQVVRDCQKKWRAAHPDYQKHYWQTHPDAAKQNQQQQRRRDQKRRMCVLVRNNLALDLKRSAAEVWLLGPGVKDLEKNNLAACQLLIFQSVAGAAAAGPSS